MTKLQNPDNALGKFLKDRRTKLDPTRFAVSMQRRRTGGLRREEVATRAVISSTYYTWLEQGRGATPSADVLDRLAQALELTDAEREHVFLLAQNRPPALERFEAPVVTPALQGVLDALGDCPAFVRTAEWDVVATNRSADVLFGRAPDVGPSNILVHSFASEPALEPDVARSMVAAFRGEITRVGFSARAREVVDQLVRSSALFRELWEGLDVGELKGGTKTFSPTPRGPISFEVSVFGIAEARSLAMVVFNPSTAADRTRLEALLRPGPATT